MIDKNDLNLLLDEMLFTLYSITKQRVPHEEIGDTYKMARKIREYKRLINEAQNETINQRY